MSKGFKRKGKVDPKILPPEQRRDYLDMLWTSIASLRTRDEVKNFFKDLLSESEAIMLARRVAVAKDLLSGAPYEAIKESHSLGSATISNVQRWLTSGFGGYDKALERFEKELYKRGRNRQKAVQRIEAGPFGSLRHKYPLHFLLFNLFDEAKAKSEFNKRNERMNKAIKKARKSRAKK